MKIISVKLHANIFLSTQGSGCGLRRRANSSRRKRQRLPVSQSVSFVAVPRAHYITVSKDGSAPLGQHKYSQRSLELPASRLPFY